MKKYKLKNKMIYKHKNAKIKSWNTLYCRPI